MMIDCDRVKSRNFSAVINEQNMSGGQIKGAVTRILTVYFRFIYCRYYYYYLFMYIYSSTGIGDAVLGKLDCRQKIGILSGPRKI